MIRQTSYIKKDRLVELQSFIRDYLPTARFVHNPIETGDNLCICLDMEVQDANKLNELFNKWYDIDNPKIPNKSFCKRLVSIFYCA